ncbi:MAG: thymidylate synthase [Alphaproteobacteria bacterium]|nr:thymidylate synthase [Alphaproteobacteria bacterium]
MHIHAQTLDDLLRKVFTALLKTKGRVSPTKGENGEIFGILLELKDPRARLSRAESRSVFFSCMGEFLWYMSGRNDLEFIKYFIPKYEKFSEKDGTVNGAYGPRIFNKDGVDQLEFVISKLRNNSESRKAVIQLYDARDTIKEYNDVPCTCTLQFVLRSGLLHMQTHMRSNDAYMGLPHDVFCFTMMQELLAVILGAKLGSYKHSVGSLHLYTHDNVNAQAFIDEGFQDNLPMPPIPTSDPFDQIKKLLDIEQKIRAGASVDSEIRLLNDYWADWARLLLIMAAPTKSVISAVRTTMKYDVYETYIRKRHKNANKNSPSASEPLLFAVVPPNGEDQK